MNKQVLKSEIMGCLPSEYIKDSITAGRIANDILDVVKPYLKHEKNELVEKIVSKFLYESSLVKTEINWKNSGFTIEDAIIAVNEINSNDYFKITASHGEEHIIVAKRSLL